jgi:hypothetical protein
MPRDRLRIGPEISPGVHSAERECGDKIEHGRLAKMQDGRPLPDKAELVRIGEPDADGWRDVHSLYKHEHAPPEDTSVETTSEEPAAARASSTRGPAQVATRAYCDGYERIFGARKVGLA